MFLSRVSNVKKEKKIPKPKILGDSFSSLQINNCYVRKHGAFRCSGFL